VKTFLALLPLILAPQASQPSTVTPDLVVELLAARTRLRPRRRPHRSARGEPDGHSREPGTGLVRRPGVVAGGTPGTALAIIGRTDPDSERRDGAVRMVARAGVWGIAGSRRARPGMT